MLQALKTEELMTGLIETTIYVKNNCKRMGIGKVLYEVLEQELKDMGILNMNACIARPIQEGRYLNDDSIRFHDNMGFTEAGHFITAVINSDSGLI